MEIMVNIPACWKGESTHGPETGGNYTYLQVKDWIKWEKKFVYGPYVHHVVGIYGRFTGMHYSVLADILTFNMTPDSTLFV